MTDRLDVKSDFSIYDGDPDFAYFDSASTTLVPKVAVNATNEFLSSTVASARRGAHRLVVSGGSLVEKVRTSLAEFLKTAKSQVSFQKSIPSAVASFVYGYDWQGRTKNKIVMAQSEEHSILVSLLRAARVLGLDVEVIPVDSDGVLPIEEVGAKVDPQTGIVAVGEVTVGTGLRNPVNEVARIAHENDALLLTDATRSVGLQDRPSTSLNADILVFSGNIGLMGPPGLAIQWIKKTVGEDHLPGILGGSAIANVEASSFEVSLQPDRFESGILNVPAIAGLGAAICYLNNFQQRGFVKHMRALSGYMSDCLAELDGLTLYGKHFGTHTRTIFGFNVGGEDGINCHDVALFLDQSNTAVRSGLLCAHPLIRSIAPEGIIQASLHVYNTFSDIDHLMDSLQTICEQLL